MGNHFLWLYKKNLLIYADDLPASVCIFDKLEDYKPYLRRVTHRAVNTTWNTMLVNTALCSLNLESQT